MWYVTLRSRIVDFTVTFADVRISLTCVIYSECFSCLCLVLMRLIVLAESAVEWLLTSQVLARLGLLPSAARSISANQAGWVY